MPKVLSIDIDKYGKRHEQFQNNPIGELEFALNEISSNDEYKKRYSLFLGPLVYSNDYDN